MSDANGTNVVAAIKEDVRLREWQQVYEEWRASGEKVREWCLEHRVAPSTFYHRLRRIREKLCEKYGNVNAEEKSQPSSGKTTR